MKFGNFIEKFNKSKEPNNLEKKKFDEGRRKFINVCGFLALGLVLQLSPESKLFAQGIENTRERFPNGINYLSKESENKYKDWERFYSDLKTAEMPVVIGSMKDYFKNVDKVTSDMFEVQFKNVKAFAFPGSKYSEDIRKLLNLRSDEIYIMYKEINEYRIMSVAYHEGRHVKHFIENIKKNSEDTEGVNKFPELSLKTNVAYEELITCSETISWLEEQIDNSKSSLTEKEKSSLLESIDFQKRYCFANYEMYYSERYANSSKAQYGSMEFKSEDKVDSFIEDIFIKHNLREFMYKGE